METSNLKVLSNLISKYAEHDGLQETGIPNLLTFKISEPQATQFTFCDAYIVVMSQGMQVCRVGNRTYDYSAGNYMTLFLPMSLEVEAVNASLEEPVLAVSIRVDLARIASLLLKLNTSVSLSATRSTDAAGIFTAPVDDTLLDPVIRLMQTLDDPHDMAILSDAIIDEIYYRIMRDDRAGEGSVQHLLEHQGQIQQIARAVNYIQSHLSEKISVEYLAELSNMSTSNFHRRFKEVMQVSPIKYAQTMKLLRAQLLLKQGFTAGEAGYQVGYTSAAQFSREYKRQFGYTPSATLHQ